MIYTEKKEFLPGEDVSGHVIVSSDNTFNCNRIILKLRGKEYTHYQAGKVHVTDTHMTLDEDVTIWEGGDIHSGDTRFDFSFKLPEDIPPVHEGVFGMVDYSVEAVVEINRALDPKSKMNLIVYAHPPAYIPEKMEQPAIREEQEHLVAEIPTDIIRPKKGILVRFLVKERSRIKGVRLDIAKHEEVTCQGRNLGSTSEVNQKHVPITYNDFDRWIEETVIADWDKVIPFEGKLIKSSIVLKVVLEIGLSIDPCIEFPLRLSGERVREDDFFDTIEMDLGW